MGSSGVVSAEQQPANAATVQSDVEAVEAALRGLWDRTRKAGELIAELRGENASLRAHAEGLQTGERFVLSDELMPQTLKVFPQAVELGSK